jgi:hypothetical protein
VGSVPDDRNRRGRVGLANLIHRVTADEDEEDWLLERKMLQKTSELRSFIGAEVDDGVVVTVWNHDKR